MWLTKLSWSLHWVTVLPICLQVELQVLVLNSLFLLYEYPRCLFKICRSQFCRALQIITSFKLKFECFYNEKEILGSTKVCLIIIGFIHLYVFCPSGSKFVRPKSCRSGHVICEYWLAEWLTSHWGVQKEGAEMPWQSWSVPQSDFVKSVTVFGQENWCCLLHKYFSVAFCDCITWGIRGYFGCQIDWSYQRSC